MVVTLVKACKCEVSYGHADWANVWSVTVVFYLGYFTAHGKSTGVSTTALSHTFLTLFWYCGWKCGLQ